MKKERLLTYFLLCFPILDFFTSIATWNSSFSFGILFKGLFFLIALFFILKNNKNKWVRFGLILFFFYFLGDISYWYFKNFVFPKKEVIHLFKVFYLPVLILFFKDFKCDKKLLVAFFLEFLILYLVPYPFGLGHNISEVYPNKNLYLSYFYVGNELANIFILLLPFAITYFIEEKKSWGWIVLGLTICMLLLLGTKAMYISVFLILLFLLWYYRKAVLPIFRKHVCLIFVFCVLSFVGLFVFLPKSSLYQNIQTSLEFYQVDSFSKFFTFENIDNIVYSNRLDFLKNVQDEYHKLSWTEKLMGLGRAKIEEIKDIEIDIFDIFYSIGIVGFLIYLFFFGVVLKQVTFTTMSFFTFLLLVVISMFSGHVFISPMTTTYLACIFGIQYGKDE